MLFALFVIFQAATLPPDFVAKMKGTTWHEGCPVAPPELRMLTLSYWDFDGREQTGRLIVNAAVAEEVVEIFHELHAAKFPVERMRPVEEYGGSDDLSMEANNTSAFNCRDVTGQPGKFSNHSWGRAIDLNPLTNPYVKGEKVLPAAGRAYLDRSAHYKGGIEKDGLVVQLFKKHGWAWGGDWKDRQDYQHFEKPAPFPAIGSGTDWAVARDGQFEIYSQAGEAPARAVLQWFELLRSLVRRETGLDLTGGNPVRVIGFSSGRAYEPYRMAATADAYYVGAGDRDYIVMPSLGNGSFPTAAHEYAHLIQHAAGSHLPPWLREGLADMLSTVQVDRHGTRIGGDVARRTNILRHRAWMPLAQLTALPASSPLREDRSVSQLFYAQSWALTEMLALSPAYGPRFRVLVAALNNGADAGTALMDTYNKPLEKVKRDLVSWVDRPPKPVLLASPPTAGTAITIAQTPASSVRLTMAGLLLAAGDLNRAESTYRELAREAPESAAAWGGLGTVAAARRQYDEAQTLWSRALALGLTDADICFRYAELLGRDGGRFEERQAALEHAVAIQPNFDEAHWSLALLENNAGHYQSALQHLQSMRTVPPARVYAYWNSMADTLNGLGRGDEAQAAAKRASEYAATGEQRAHAAQLAYIARTHLAVRLERDDAGNSRLVTTRVPNDDTQFNPFIEPSDDLRRVLGTLREIECGSPAQTMRITVETSGGSLKLTIPDPGPCADGQRTAGIPLRAAARQSRPGGVCGHKREGRHRPRPGISMRNGSAKRWWAL